MSGPLHRPVVTKSFVPLWPATLISFPSLVPSRSVLAAAVSIGLFSAMKPKIPFTQLEANVCQTVASAAGSMTMAAGLIGPIPALHLLGMRYSVWTMMTWGASVAFLGVFFAVPLRRHFLLESQLRFPSGTATAETIKSMFADARRAKSQVGTLIHASVFAAGTVVLTWCFPWVLRPPVFATLGLASAARWGWGIRIDATLVGGGILMGTRVGVSVLVGGVCAWGIVGPWAAARGWVTGDPLSMKGGARGLLLWPGVTMMAVDSLMQLALATVCRPRRRRKLGGGDSSNIVRAGGDQAADQVDLRRRRRRRFERGSAPRRRRRRRRRRTRAAQVPGRPAKVQADARGLGGDRGRQRTRRTPPRRRVPAGDAPPSADFKEDHPDAIPRSWWIVGLAVTGVWTASVLHLNFGMALWQPVLALPVAAVMSYVAVRCTGETDINPIGPMGKIIQLVFALVAPGAIVTNLMAAAVACGGAGQAGDLMHDFRAGMMMRLSPRKQLLAQLMGIPIGILGAVPTYALFAATYPIGGEQFPAPAAVAWRAVAEVLTGPGGGGLPGGGQGAHGGGRVVHRVGSNGGASGGDQGGDEPELPRRALDQAVDDKPHERGDSVHHPPEFSTTIAIAAIGSGYWERRGQGAPRGSRVHRGERFVGRGGGDGGGHRAGVHGVRDHRAGNVIS